MRKSSKYPEERDPTPKKVPLGSGLAKKAANLLGINRKRQLDKEIDRQSGTRKK